ncbi:hypothetical protein CN138_08955 [Sinorhizobium meliloti]|uniref:hypothetical protein n=1 Tax=Rhizobium meliloti TaxID=382 RepID=UPI000FD28B6F|nr:hypothetical protein [Sinorhizobium meliloti]RVL48448.1 hypothetical protein CN145_23075 [Sinorhizobium meliloti]RVL72382.1 hypothetical protein CN138_08955 [Sinorhizobium meliloti]
MAKSTEAAPIYVQRQGDKLAGEMEMDREAIARFNAGDRIKVTLHTGRSPSRLRFYWQMLGKLVAATDCSPNAEALHSVIKLDLGYATPVRLKNGMTVLVPGSIAFDRMTEEEFGGFLDRAIKWIAENYSVTPEEIMNGGLAA